MKRRTFLKTGLASGLGVALNPSGAVFAQNKQIVVANWGGDWNTRTVKYIEAPLLEKQGYQIVRELGGEPERTTKLLAAKHLPRGTIDVVHVDQTAAFTLNSNGILETIDYSKIPNAAHLIESLKTPYFMPWLYSGWEVLYDPDHIKDAPTSFADLSNPKYAGRVGLMSEHYDTDMWAASLLASGNLTDFEGAKKVLLAWKKAVKPRIYPTHQQLEAGFKSGEIWIGTDFRSRALQFHADGVNVRPAFPKEGPILTIYGVSIPKRAPNKEAAYAYLNAMLDPKALAGLCAENFYSPSSTAAVLPGDLATKVSYTDQQRKLFHIPDEVYWEKNQSAWFEWYNTTFVA